MAINREMIHELVEVFYQHPFKTFYINSIDEKSFIKPVGVFVSLGITTSMKVLEDFKNIIKSNGYNACIVEISSKKITNQYLNTVTNIENPKQYKIVDLDENLMSKDQAIEELNRMKDLMSPDQNLDILKEYAPKISKLLDLVNKLTDTNGWDAHLIQKDGDDYRIFHRYVNYKKDNNIEYRIGIYVSEDKKDN